MNDTYDTQNKIVLENVTFAYNPGTPLEKRALENISLCFERGKVTGIAGHTGSGKSTIVRLLNGLEKPNGGRVLLDGEDIWANPKKIGKIRFRVGLVMQYPEYQLFEETVRADISYGPRRMGLDDEEINRRVIDSAAICGVSESDLDRSPFELSGGQKRRAAIAGIMAMRPEVLVLDEPAAGLDPEGRSVIFGAVLRYMREYDASVIIVSHSMENMAEYCDNIAVLRQGKLELSGKKEDIFSQPELLIKAGLDVPEITSLAMKLEERGIRVSNSVFTVGYTADKLSALFEERRRAKNA